MAALPPPAQARARVRWGLPDVVLAWVAGFVASFFALPLYDDGVPFDKQPLRFLLAALLLQNLGIVAALVAISAAKGQGSLSADFGLVWPFDRLRPQAVIGWLAAGAGLSIAANVLLLPITELAHLDEPSQEVSKALDRASGPGRVLFAAVVVLVAPTVEELLFRGALLRALQRRFVAPLAIFVSAALFAAVHVVGDPGSGYIVPALLLLGLVSGYQASKRGDLSRSVLLHAGFNLVAAIALAFN